MRRREFIKTATQGACFVALSSCTGGMGMGGMGGGDDDDAPSLNGEEGGGVLFAPPLLLGTLVDGVRTFDLQMQTGQVQFTGNGTTNTLGINGPFLAPTLRVRRGEQVQFNVHNGLSEETSLHWHGMRVPGEMDGGPHQKILPGETWQASYPIIQPASTNWYHPHVHETTARQVYSGLAGMLIVDDDEAEALGLPNTYDVDDFPIIVQDRDMDASGVFEYSLSMMERMQGKKGNTFLVNGQISPTLSVPAKTVRLRLLNGSNSRIYRFELSDGTQLQLIANEQALLSAPVPLADITMSPGERYEVVVDLSGREGETLSFRDGRTGTDIFTIEVQEEAVEPAPLPTTLISFAQENPNDAVRVRPFVLSMRRGSFTINGASMEMDTINEELRLNEVEIWELQNTSMMAHNFHVHGVHFQLIDRDGGPPEPYEVGLKDTVYLPANSRVRVVIRFMDYTTDASAPYMYHCHILEHEDAGMMGQLVVTA